MRAGDLYRVTRRAFLTEVGRGVFAVAILGVSACTTIDGSAEDSSTTEGTASGGLSTTEGTASGGPSTSAGPDTTTTPTDAGVTVRRVFFGNVSAYVLIRGAEAVIVDTGNPGSEDDIEAALSEVGLGWGHVGSVILTHRHPDHIGSVGPVMEAASQAFGYAGAPDIPAIDTPRPLTPVGDGDTVFGLPIIETPGHTEGSISVYDPIAKVLVVGDAMNGGGTAVAGDNELAGANPRFSADMATADASVEKLARLDFDTVYFGHGDPVEANGSALVRALAATL
jgi:glyoxylase-like metal-dependent hydrolase (beta-lactamase superfamily II)